MDEATTATYDTRDRTFEGPGLTNTASTALSYGKKIDVRGVRQIEPDEDLVENLDEYENPFKLVSEHGEGDGQGDI